MMNDMAGWIWPVVAVVIGLGLGVMIGALRQRSGRHEHAPARDLDGQDHGPISMLPGQAGEGGREGSPQQRLLERLRATNLQLNAQLKSLAESNSRQAQEREAERQSEKLRQERELEELRQAHAGELSHLMNTLVEQVDGMNKAHAEQLKALEAEVEKVRQEARRTTTSPGALPSGSGGATRPGAMAGTVAPAGPAAGAQPAPAIRGTGAASDYSVTLPMETFRGQN